MEKTRSNLFRGRQLSYQSQTSQKFFACVGSDQYSHNLNPRTKNSPPLKPSQIIQSPKFPLLQKLRKTLDLKYVRSLSPTCSNSKLSDRSLSPNRSQEPPMMQILSVSPKVGSPKTEYESSKLLFRKNTNQKIQVIEREPLSATYPVKRQGSPYDSAMNFYVTNGNRGENQQEVTVSKPQTSMGSPEKTRLLRYAPQKRHLSPHETGVNFYVTNGNTGENQPEVTVYKPQLVLSSQLPTIEDIKEHFLKGNNTRQKKRVNNKRAVLRELTSPKSITSPKKNLDLQVEAVTAIYTSPEGVLDDLLGESSGGWDDLKLFKSKSLKKENSPNRTDFQSLNRKRPLIKTANSGKMAASAINFSGYLKIESLSHKAQDVENQVSQEEERRNMESVMDKLGKIVTVGPFQERPEGLSPGKATRAVTSFKK